MRELSRDEILNLKMFDEIIIRLGCGISLNAWLIDIELEANNDITLNCKDKHGDIIAEFPTARIYQKSTITNNQ